MSLTIDQKDLNAAVKLAAPVASRAPRLPILRGVHLHAKDGRLGLTASDGELSVQTHCEAAGELDPVVLAADQLARFAGAVKGTGTIESEDEGVRLRFGGSELVLPSMRPDDFPRVKTTEGEATMLSADVTARLARVLFAAGKDPARPLLCGVGFGNGQAACTDSYRLAVVDLGAGLPDAIIPAEAVRQVLKYASGDIAMTVDPVRATFAAANGTWTTRLIEGQFPNYRQLIPAAGAGCDVLSVDAEALIDALDRLEPLGDTEHPVSLANELGQLRITVRSGGIEASEWLDVESMAVLDGYGLNSKYLADAVKACGDTIFRLEVRDGTKPVVQRGEGWVSLLMPVRVGLNEPAKAKR